MSKEDELINRTLTALLTGQQAMSGSLTRMGETVRTLNDEVEALQSASAN